MRLRADRTGGVHDELFLAAETDLGAVLTHIEEVRPTLLVVDSIQTIGASGIDGVPGGVTQVKEVAAALIRVAKTRNITTVLVGHVTKDGSIAGPRVLEHLVDVVLHFEGERNSRFRMVRAMKNRYGPVDEVGCFDLSSEGISAVTDPTGLFVEHHTQDVSGTCVAVTMEGRRPLLAEVQALLTPSPLERPRRTVSGRRVLARRHGAGRARRATPGCASPAATPSSRPSAGPSSTTRPPTWPSRSRSPAPTSACPPPRGAVAIGEIGLAGELRRVRDLPQRIAEAARLGFKVAVVPRGRALAERARHPDAGGWSTACTVVEVDDVFGALLTLELTPPL